MGSFEPNNEFLLDIGRDGAFCARAGLIGNREPKSEFRLDGVVRDVVGRDVVCGRAGLIGSIELNSELFLFVDDVVDEAVVRGRAGLIGRLETNSELSAGMLFPVLVEPREVSVSPVGSETCFCTLDRLVGEVGSDIVTVGKDSVGWCSKLPLNGVDSFC